MNWTVMGKFWMQSDADYIVSKSGTGDGWLYSAWAPRIADDQYRARIKAHYAVGEPVTRWRELIGVYRDTEAAKQSCERHRGQVA